jgi:hypothetical protein
VDAADPSQQEGFGLHVLQLENPEEFQVQRFQLVILYLDDSLQNRGVVLGVRIDLSLNLSVQVLFIHVLLDLHYSIENGEDVGLGVRQRIYEKELLFNPV